MSNFFYNIPQPELPLEWTPIAAFPGMEYKFRPTPEDQMLPGDVVGRLCVRMGLYTDWEPLFEHELVGSAHGLYQCWDSFFQYSYEYAQESNLAMCPCGAVPSKSCGPDACGFQGEEDL